MKQLIGLALALVVAAFCTLQAQSEGPAAQETQLKFHTSQVGQELIDTLAEAFEYALREYEGGRSEPDAAMRLNEKLYDVQIRAGGQNRLVAENYVCRAKKIEAVANRNLENGLGTAQAALEAKASRLSAVLELAKFQR